MESHLTSNIDLSSDQQAKLEPIKFTGDGFEYFKIWIVSLVLTIVTLGVYSAWAKVRRTQYFYSNTYIANSSFDYTADPFVILKGRFLVVLFFVPVIVILFLARGNPGMGWERLLLL